LGGLDEDRHTEFECINICSCGKNMC
jgi:hypothetical protein